MVEVGAYSSIVYWLTALNDGDAGGRFGYFMYISFLFYWTMRSFVRMCAVWSPSLLIAQSFAPTFVALLLLFGGYLVPRVVPTFIKIVSWRIAQHLVSPYIQEGIPGWWIWMFYANPVSYAFYGLVGNEFFGKEYKCRADDLQPPTNTWNFNLPYPKGFEGTILTPIKIEVCAVKYRVNDSCLPINRQPGMSYHQRQRLRHIVLWSMGYGMAEMDNVSVCHLLLAYLHHGHSHWLKVYETQASCKTQNHRGYFRGRGEGNGQV